MESMYRRKVVKTKRQVEPATGDNDQKEAGVITKDTEKTGFWGLVGQFFLALGANFGKSINQFILTGVTTIIFFYYVPEILYKLVPTLGKFEFKTDYGTIKPYVWICAVFIYWLLVATIHYLWGEHWPVGKKKYGFATLGFIVIFVVLLQLYWPTDLKHFFGKDSKPVNSQTIVPWKEGHTFSKQGEVWFTDHIFGAGEKILIIVKYNPVQLVQGTKEEKDLNPGTHERSITGGGVVAFKNLGNQTAKVIVQKKSI